MSLTLFSTKGGPLTNAEVDGNFTYLEGRNNATDAAKLDKTAVGQSVAPLVAGKVPLGNLPDSVVSGLSYKGTWNAATNMPNLTTVQASGSYYVVAVAGTFGGTAYQQGDWIISNGTQWQRYDATAAFAASLTSTPGGVPRADSNGHIENEWLSPTVQAIIAHWGATVNDIGTPGTQGFGVGICPDLPDGYSALPGTYVMGSKEYGNYQYSDGSIMVWVPAFYYRIGHVDNPKYATYGANSIDVKPFAAFADGAAANAAGYALHRAFIDGGQIVPGFMRDKYHCSASAGVASSLYLGNPLSSNSAHNPFSLVGAANNCGGAIGAAKTRGVQFFPESVFISSAIALLSLAHGQAATSAVNCAWYEGTGVANFPKGNNNNALKDTNDASVAFVSDGFQNAAKTGSGSPFEKTTHNGQACGIADVNGNMWRINLGMTCIAASKAISGATKTSPVQLTVSAHGLTTGDQVIVEGVGGMTQINARIYTVTVVDINTVSLDGVNGTGFGTYTSGGTLISGKFYAAKQSTKMQDFTAGTSGATDHWGATGVTAMMEQVPLRLRSDYPNNAVALRYGNATTQVFDPAVSGNGWVLTGLGMPAAEGAVSPSGANLFGVDYFYQYLRNELCALSGGAWGDTSYTGAFARILFLYRTDSNRSVGLACASYPVRLSGS